MSASCAQTSGLSFCNRVNYRVPVPSGGNTTNAAQAYDDRARKYYDNFTQLLDQFDCDNRYSFERNCDNCRDAYKDWLCAMTVPQCHQGDSAGDSYDPKDPNLLARPKDNGRALPSTGTWTEVLPCVGLCYRVVQSCPAYFQFACPSISHNKANSYGVDLKQLTQPESKLLNNNAVQCNNIGIGEALMKNSGACSHRMDTRTTSMSTVLLLLYFIMGTIVLPLFPLF
ncbi:stretch-activated Ca2+-permeable channel component-domain-containing protein [Syncephalis fuscata]|nr:stretch-activated Ca2+-permeable channel component-domain-containing protein [Syncephalis fuscata]